MSVKRLLCLLAVALVAALLGGCDGDLMLEPAWVLFELPEGPAAGLRDIDQAREVVYVVGAQGQAWRLGGDGWEAVFHEETDIEFTGVAVRNDGGAWVCGADSVGRGRLFEHTLQDGWSEVNLKNAAFLAAVAVDETGGGVVVGSRGQVWVLKDSEWELHAEEPDYIWRSVAIAADGSFLVVGRDALNMGAFLYHDGDDDGYTDSLGERLEDCVLHDGGGWVVGDDGGLFRFEDGELEWVVSGGSSLRGLALRPGSTSSGWLCGLGGLLIAFTEDNLRPTDSETTENLQALTFVAPDKGWAAAQTHLLHYR